MTPDLSSYDILLVNTSAGKDSQAMLDHVVALATAAGVRDRIVCVHADLGRVEWPGTRELAVEQVEHYGLPIHIVKREQGDLLDQVAERGMWPDSARRYCTSDQKRGPVLKLMTLLTAQIRLQDRNKRVRILNMMGLRAQESRARAMRPDFSNNERATNGRRHVDEWLPIHSWTEQQVWDRIKASGVRHHPAYDKGMPRLSCMFCVLASKSALVLSAQLNPEMAAEYVALETRIGHRFRKDLSMSEVVTLAAATPVIEHVDGWAA